MGIAMSELRRRVRERWKVAFFGAVCIEVLAAAVVLLTGAGK
jgi:hypothetical protein